MSCFINCLTVRVQKAKSRCRITNAQIDESGKLPSGVIQSFPSSCCGTWRQRFCFSPSSFSFFHAPQKSTKKKSEKYRPLRKKYSLSLCMYVCMYVCLSEYSSNQHSSVPLMPILYSSNSKFTEYLSSPILYHPASGNRSQGNISLTFSWAIRRRSKEEMLFNPAFTYFTLCIYLISFSAKEFSQNIKYDHFCDPTLTFCYLAPISFSCWGTAF